MKNFKLIVPALALSLAALSTAASSPAMVSEVTEDKGTIAVTLEIAADKWEALKVWASEVADFSDEGVEVEVENTPEDVQYADSYENTPLDK